MSELHPVRFTRKQVEFIQHFLSQFDEYFEEEGADLSETITKSVQDKRRDRRVTLRNIDQMEEYKP